MAGLFGFYTRAPRAREWMQARLQLLQRAMVTRPDHRAHMELHDHAAFGNSGPGLHAGTLTSYTRRDGAVLVAEGEIYRIDAWSSADHPFEQAWPLVHEQWRDQPDTLSDIDGLYSLVRYEPDSADGPRLSLANDRYGSRRLFILEDGDEFVFAADFRAVAAWLGPRLTIDRQFISDAICLGTPLGDRTWAEQIRLYPSATEYRVSRRGVRTRRYWDCSRLPPAAPEPPRDMLARVDAAWRAAMARRMRGDRLGQKLSGGLDSRLILADGRHRGDDWLAVTYGEPGSDEVRFAKASAKAAHVSWMFWELPGEDWLERRVALSLENGGFVDLMNAHQAGLLQHLRGRLSFDISGYAGDVVLGDTYTGLSPLEAFWKVPYWHSPVSDDESVMETRVRADLGNREPWAWFLDTKMRRAINGWPHLAVNDAEVRKPFMDYAFVEYCASLPRAARHASAIHERLLRTRAPSLARVPIPRTGVRPGASAAHWQTLRVVRYLYRTVQPRAATLGLPLRPWVRGAVDVTRWLQDARVQATLRDVLVRRDARIAAYVEPRAVAETLTLGFEGRLANEVPLNLYRIERVLQELPRWASGL